jgi:hypothetical protein
VRVFFEFWVRPIVWERELSIREAELDYYLDALGPLFWECPPGSLPYTISFLHLSELSTSSSRQFTLVKAHVLEKDTTHG